MQPTGVAADSAGLIAELKAIADTVRRTFGSLRAAELTWQPVAGEWSIAQCFEHLILSNAVYFPILGRIARGEWRPTLKERLPLLPKLFGKAVLNAVQPDTRRRVKARPKFQPSSGGVGGDIIDRFLAHQQELCRHVQVTAGCDWHKTIITSPVISFMTYSLFDAYRIIVTHEEHHLVQARRVVDAPGFPRVAATASET